jgi:excinuclease ABC subunit C
LRGKVAVIGIAKKLEEIYFPDDPTAAHRQTQQQLRVIQHMRNEAHRFGITHHRGKRSKRIVRTGLEEIPGIGPGTAQKLLKEFGSIRGIKEAAPAAVQALIGESRATVLLKALAVQ